MGYYQVLKGRYITHYNHEADYSYYWWWWDNSKSMGFEVYLRDINTNKLFLLEIGYFVLNKFDWERELRQSTFGYIKLQEINKDVMDSVERFLIPKGDGTISILDNNGDCGDISNYFIQCN